jgi:hypothetical protein
VVPLITQKIDAFAFLHGNRVRRRRLNPNPKGMLGVSSREQEGYWRPIVDAVTTEPLRHQSPLIITRLRHDYASSIQLSSFQDDVDRSPP